MPVIILEAAKLSNEQKKLVKEFTSSAAKIMNLPEEVFYVFLRKIHWIMWVLAEDCSVIHKV